MVERSAGVQGGAIGARQVFAAAVARSLPNRSSVIASSLMRWFISISTITRLLKICAGRTNSRWIGVIVSSSATSALKKPRSDSNFAFWANNLNTSCCIWHEELMLVAAQPRLEIVLFACRHLGLQHPLELVENCAFACCFWPAKG